METITNILITGGNSGIGKAAALAYASLGFDVTITSRDIDRGKIAVNDISHLTGNNRVRVIQGDLSTVQSCRLLVKNIFDELPAINILINNAGVLPTRKMLNSDGFEMCFMVNYLAPFILSTELLPLLRSGSRGRILNVNSIAHHSGNINLDGFPYGEHFRSLRTYSNSKLANAMFTYDFAEKIKDTGVTINAFHPGVYVTNLFTKMKLPGFAWDVMKLFCKDISVAADAAVYLGMDPSLEGITGNFFKIRKQSRFARKVFNKSIRDALWEKTEEWIKR